MSRFSLKPVITIKFNEVDRQAVENTVNRVFPSLTEENTAKDLFQSMFNILEKPVNQDESITEERILKITTPLNEVIQEKDNEIGRLKTLLGFKDDEILKLKTSLQSSNPSPGVILEENDEIITFDPIFGGLVDIEIQAAQAQKGTIYTRAQVLKNLFLDMIRGRDRYPLCKAWSTADLKAYRDKLTAKTAE